MRRRTHQLAITSGAPEFGEAFGVWELAPAFGRGWTRFGPRKRRQAGALQALREESAPFNMSRVAFFRSAPTVC
jgi:hypothetical protein